MNYTITNATTDWSPTYDVMNQSVSSSVIGLSVYDAMDNTAASDNVVDSDKRKFFDSSTEDSRVIWRQARIVDLTPVIVLDALFMLFGVVGNSVVCYICLCRIQRNVIDSFVLALAAVELFGCIFTIPVDITELLNMYAFDFPVLCKIEKYSRKVVIFSTGCILVAIAAERYKRIVKPHGRHVTMTQFRMAIIGSVIFSLIMAVPEAVLAGTGTVVSPFGVGKICSVYQSDQYRHTLFPKVWGGVVVFIYLLSLSAIGITYFVIASKIWKRGKVKTDRRSKPNTPDSTLQRRVSFFRQNSNNHPCHNQHSHHQLNHHPHHRHQNQHQNNQRTSLSESEPGSPTSEQNYSLRPNNSFRTLTAGVSNHYYGTNLHTCMEYPVTTDLESAPLTKDIPPHTGETTNAQSNHQHQTRRKHSDNQTHYLTQSDFSGNPPADTTNNNVADITIKAQIHNDNDIDKHRELETRDLSTENAVSEENALLARRMRKNPHHFSGTSNDLSDGIDLQISDGKFERHGNARTKTTDVNKDTSHFENHRPVSANDQEQGGDYYTVDSSYPFTTLPKSRMRNGGRLSRHRSFQENRPTMFFNDLFRSLSRRNPRETGNLSPDSRRDSEMDNFETFHRFQCLTPFGSFRRKAGYSRKRTTFIMFVMTLTTALSLLPHVAVMIYSLTHQEIETKLSSDAAVIFRIAWNSFFISLASHPFVYGFWNGRFKHALSSLFTGFRRGRHWTDRDSFSSARHS